MAKAQAATIFDRPALHPYPLRGAGDGGKQRHKALFVHLAAVGGKGVVAPLHAEGKQDAPVGVRCKGGVFGSQTVSQTLFNAVGKDSLPCPGEKDVHRLLVLNKGMEQFTGQLLCVCSGKPHIGHTVQNDMDELVLQPAGQLIDILIVGIKGGFVHLGQCAQVF